MKERKCIICDCTDSKACAGGCYWIDPFVNLCDQCTVFATLLKANGERVRLMPKERYLSLEEIQEAVGGCIELVFKPGLANLGLIVFANEEGLILDLPYNNLAKEVLNRDLVGDVLIVPKYLMEPEDNDDEDEDEDEDDDDYEDDWVIEDIDEYEDDE